VACSNACVQTKWHLDPSNRLATIHQRYRQTGQHSCSAGQTVACNGDPQREVELVDCLKKKDKARIRKNKRTSLMSIFQMVVGWWRWALVSPDGVAPSRMVSVSASVNSRCTIKCRSSLLEPSHPGGPGKRAVKRLWWSF